VERDGRVRAQVISHTGSGEIRPRVLDTVKPGATLFSDGYQVYQSMPQFDHAWVDHSHDEWTRGVVHTQTIEGFWSVMKGGLRGVYRGAVRRQHFQSYVDEYAFHWNTRNALGGPDPFRVLYDRAIAA